MIRTSRLGPFRLTTKVPGDKSISHRSVMFGSIAEGVTEIEGFLPGADCLSTIHCFRQMGVEIERTSPTSVRVKGKGFAGLAAPRFSPFCSTWQTSKGRQKAPGFTSICP
jgi:3-phosphoshikimate 1-carboxyvinyltransferase